MKLGKMLSVGEVVEHTTDEPAVAPTPVSGASEAVEVSPVAEVADLPTPVAAHADR
jgi:hypothetical protein